jgi:hypothetical protein
MQKIVTKARVSKEIIIQGGTIQGLTKIREKVRQREQRAKRLCCLQIPDVVVTVVKGC